MRRSARLPHSLSGPTLRLRAPVRSCLHIRMPRIAPLFPIAAPWHAIRAEAILRFI